MTTTTAEAATRAKLEAAYVEAIADDSDGAHGRAMQLASDPALRGHVTSVDRDREAVALVRQLLHVKHASATRLGDLQALRDKAETKLAQSEATLADSKREFDDAKAEHHEREEAFLLCGQDIEFVQYQCETKPYVRRVVEAEVNAAGIL